MLTLLLIVIFDVVGVSGDVDVNVDGDVLTLLLIVDFDAGNVFICVCLLWPLLFFTNLTPH